MPSRGFVPDLEDATIQSVGALRLGPAPAAEREAAGSTTRSAAALSALSTPSSLRRAILIHLRQAGPTSPDGLAAALGASRTGVLQQLHALESAQLVAHAAE
jgi:hypothetical protein